MNADKFSVSGWDDDLQDIDPSRNPEDKLERLMLEAAEAGNLETVKSLVEQNKNLIFATDKDTYTPLHRACYGNHLEVVKYLVEHGANVSAQSDMLWEPLHSCCQWGHYECAAFLIQHGANVNAMSKGGQTPLHIAASHGTSYGISELLAMHPYINPNLKNNSGDTPRDIALRSSKYHNIFDMVDPLIDPKEFEKNTVN